MKTMDDLFLHFLQDIYYAEKQGLKALAKVGKNVQNEDLREFLQEHREESQDQIGKLEEVFQQVFGKKARGKTCEAMKGLIAEVDEAISEGEKGPVLDAALIACVQAMKHYEIARIGALAAWAKQMGHNATAETLHDIVEQDKDADEELTHIAEEHADAQSSEGDEDDEEGEDAAEPAEETQSAPAPSRGSSGRKKG